MWSVSLAAILRSSSWDIRAQPPKKQGARAGRQRQRADGTPLQPPYARRAPSPTLVCATPRRRRTKQDWEVAVAILYVVAFITPLAFWLFYTFVLLPASEKKSESQNASAAADDGGGDEGGGDF
jgi:hypothetical protein